MGIEKGEEIFSIKKSADDNLSANSLNTLYGSYYGSLTGEALKYFGENDLRSNLIGRWYAANQPLKYTGIDSDESTSNIRIFRVSEMTLALAEIYARKGDIAKAQDYLFYTAQRDADIASATDLPSTTADLLTFISAERIREFFGEGHRFYDARRMGDIVNADSYKNFDIQKFHFPVPADEVNAGKGISQVEGWDDNLPE